jgi:CHAT domain-containing protein
LADAITTAESANPSMAADSSVNFLASQKRKIHFLRDQIDNLTDTAKKKREADKLRNALVDADRNVELTENRINKQYPVYGPTRHKSKLPTLDDLADYSKRNNACVVEYFWGVTNVYALAVFHDNIVIKKLGRTDSLQNKILPVHDFLVSNENSFNQTSSHSFSQDSYDLYLSILAPFSDLIGHTEKLVIIPDGSLSLIPFETLVMTPQVEGYNQLNYLIKDHVVSYSFSSAYLLKPFEEIQGNNRLLAFGFTGGSPVRSGRVKIQDNELSGSDEELKSLKEKFKDGSFLSGGDVTETNFKAMAADYDFLHLALHGEGDVYKNYSSSLFFRDSTSIDDGKLHWYELFGLKLKAKLAVISSCESGIGKVYRGEGMLSMANAFAAAGCGNIVMGMWKVDDRVSAQLMDQFYKNIRMGLPVDEALVEAKRTYLLNADEFATNPRLWASLVAYGNHRVISEDSRITIYILFAVILSGFFILHYFVDNGKYKSFLKFPIKDNAGRRIFVKWR